MTLEEEIAGVPVAIAHALEHLDFVRDPFQAGLVCKG